MERFLKIFGLGLRKMIEKSGPVGRYSHDVIILSGVDVLKMY